MLSCFLSNEMSRQQGVSHGTHTLTHHPIILFLAALCPPTHLTPSAPSFNCLSYFGHRPTDGIVSEVLFYTIRRCLGEAYDKEIHNVWVKVVSRMLKIMVPVAVAYEIQSGGVHQKSRISEMSRLSGGPSAVSGASTASGGEDEMEKKYGK